jgi:hypothetical protein
MTQDLSKIGTNVEALASSVKTATFSTPPQYCNGIGTDVVIDVTAVSGTAPSVVTKLQRLDETSGKWLDIPGAATAALTAVGTQTLQIYPGIAAVANQAVNRVMAKVWRATCTVTGTAPSFTMTISAVDIR